MDKSPKILVFAGANGSGKTTLAEEVLPYLGIKEFVNADEIARGLSPFNPEGQRVKAGKLLIGRVKELIEKKEDFAIESTLSGMTLSELLKHAKCEGYWIRIYYIYTSNVELNIKRIEGRVKQKGHFVPTVDVLRRYKRGLENLFRVYFDLGDVICVYDGTTSPAAPVAVKANGTTLILKNALSVWQEMFTKAGI